MVKSILKSFGLSKSQSNPREEIEDIISEEGQKEEAFDAHEKLLLKNILGLRTITAADVMVPRADIIAVDIDESSENIIKKMTTAGHSRLPVFKGDLDKDLVEEIVGEIEDEHDEQDEPMVLHSGKGILLADARIELEEIGKLTGNLKTSETDAEIDTLGGLICSIIGRVPGRGECIRHESGIEFEIIDGDARRIRKVKIRGLDENKIITSNFLLSNE